MSKKTISTTTQTMQIGAVEIPVLEYQGQRVVTFAMIDKVHQRPEGTARWRFNDNRKQFTENEDYFYVTDHKSLCDFRTTHPGVLSESVHNIIFITESGYLLIAKVLTDDLAWQIQKMLIKTYFRVREVLSSSTLPYHLERYLANRQCIPYTHFSILAQLTLHLIAPLESLNYSLPEKMLPDISEGLLFNRWLRENKNFDTDTLPTYVHTYEDGRQVRAKLYPIELLPDFIKHFYEIWLPEHAPNYFATRDSTALPLMPKLLESRLTKSLTDLLKEHQIALSTQKVNKILLDMGFLAEKTRPSVTKGTKKFKVLTEQGQVYGKNVVNPRKPEETHPVYYTDTFPQLLAKILAWQTQH